MARQIPALLWLTREASAHAQQAAGLANIYSQTVDMFMDLSFVVALSHQLSSLIINIVCR